MCEDSLGEVATKLLCEVEPNPVDSPHPVHLGCAPSCDQKAAPMCEGPHKRGGMIMHLRLHSLRTPGNATLKVNRRQHFPEGGRTCKIMSM